MRQSYQVSQRRACRALGFHRSTVCNRSKADPRVALRMRLRDLASVRVGYGYQRLHILLRREGWSVNHKRVCQLYREQESGLMRKFSRRHVSCKKRGAKSPAQARNECWSMDFMSDELFDGRRIRQLTLIDNHTRQSLAIGVSQRIRGIEVVQVLERITKKYGKPSAIKVDNGPEFISKDLDRWAYWNKVDLDFSRPGTPSNNAFIELLKEVFLTPVPEQYGF
jgi:putative transposase